MSKANFQVTYSGPTLRAGSMDVRDLAPALLAIGELCQVGNRIFNGDRAQLSVHVRSEFQKGSFEISLDVIQTLPSQVKTFLLGDDLKAARMLLELLFGGGIGLFGLIKWLKGKKPTGSTTLDNGNVQIEIHNHHIEVKQEVYALFQNEEVRKASLGIVRPLQTEGIEKLDVIENKKKMQTVTQEEVQYFSVPDDEGILIDQERIAFFEIVKLSFERYKWTVSDGTKINVDIDDDEFFDKIQRRQISFARGDVLKVKLRTRTWQAEKGLKSEHKIVKVLEVIQGPKQLPIDIRPMHLTQPAPRCSVRGCDGRLSTNAHGTGTSLRQ